MINDIYQRDNIENHKITNQIYWNMKHLSITVTEVATEFKSEGKVCFS